jgi:ubiquitin carboxyl-terminal hydrolase 10
LRTNSNTKTFQGAQEDAQEFLTFLLDQIHEELLACRKSLKWRFSQTSEGERDSDVSGEWLEVGKGQKVTLARTMEHVVSPISFLFYGRYRSIVKRPRLKDSITTEPFHCISLEIQDESIETLSDAFSFMTKLETIEGQITRRMMIESAPPVLIVQLKRFVYSQSHGVEKLPKYIQYPEYLELDPSVLHMSKPLPGYHLYAVIYHHGRTADGGHYTCHVRQSLKSADTWLHFDDATHNVDLLESVLAQKGNWRNAYLLFYIRHKGKSRSS